MQQLDAVVKSISLYETLQLLTIYALINVLVRWRCVDNSRLTPRPYLLVCPGGSAPTRVSQTFSRSQAYIVPSIINKLSRASVILWDVGDVSSGAKIKIWPDKLTSWSTEWVLMRSYFSPAPWGLAGQVCTAGYWWLCFYEKRWKLTIWSVIFAIWRLLPVNAIRVDALPDPTTVEYWKGLSDRSDYLTILLPN